MINQTAAAISQFQEIKLVLKQTESNIRAFALSTDSVYLIPSIAEQQDQISTNLLSIQKSGQLDDLAPKSISVLKNKIDSRFAFWKKVITEPDCLKNKECYSEDNRQMNELELLFNSIIYDHKKLLLEQNRIYNNYTEYLIPVILITSLLGIIISFISYMGLKNDLKVKVENLTQLNNLKTELEFKVNSLNRSNYELDQFAYVASHDLQEPLRKIISFSEVLIHEKDSKLSSTATSYLGVISKASVRMKRLIEDLLEYSRLSQTSAHEYEEIELEIMLVGILKDLEIPIKEKQVDISLSKLPPIWGIKFQLNQLFLNLISNSLKYSSPNRLPIIKINHQIINGNLIFDFSAHASEQYCKIEVIDNGIGFEEKYAQDIFMIFNRLHSRHEYEGTGIGLSICKRVVENHKGFIQAFGHENEGAMFRVYLPIKPINHYA
ncbi:sensor histidine kinase [Solitalea longa]|nr:ATP-binding protein [Solitalea longa]